MGPVTCASCIIKTLYGVYMAMRILLLHEWAYQSTKHLAGPHMLIGLCSFTDESKMTDGFYSFQLAYKV